MKTVKIDREKIKKVADSRWLIYLLLVFSVVNATFRLTESGMSTPFRLLSPVMAAAMLFLYWKRFAKALTWLAVAAIYGITVSVLFYRHVAFDMWVFLGYLFILYLLVMMLYHSLEDFTRTFFRFLNLITVITLVLCWLQFFIRVPYKYLNLAADPGVNVFMSNENELASPLCCMLMIYLYRIFFKKECIYSVQAVNIVFFIFINDAKMCLLGIALGAGIYCVYGLYRLLRKKTGIAPRKLVLSLVVVAVLLVALVFLLNPEIPFRNYTISLKDLVLDSVMDIILLRPITGTGGSIMDRTNAIIYGMMELRNTSFFGIGWGNSVQMLQMPQYQLRTAKSMHNIIAQFLAEFGFFAIACYVLICIWIFKSLKNAEKQSVNIMKVAFALSFILISSQSSVGILSNYYTWMVVFYIALSYRCKKNGRTEIEDNYEPKTVQAFLQDARKSWKLGKGILAITAVGVARTGKQIKRYLDVEKKKENEEQQTITEQTAEPPHEDK